VFAILLPFTFALLWRWQRKTGKQLRTSFFAAATIWASGLVVLTEVLSYFQHITKGWLLGSWSGFAVVSAALLWRSEQQSDEPTDKNTEGSCESLGRSEQALLAGIVILLVVTGILAIASPPNTDDVMEYHLPRVVLWASNHSVQFFPAFDYSHLIHTPWAEYVALHFYVLSGSDHWGNLIEWFAFLGCIVGASLVAGRLGADWRGQVLAAVFCGTLPELILEASGSNNTAVGSFWIVALVVFLLQDQGSLSWRNALLAGAASGLALLTKGTAVLFLPIIVVALFLIQRPQPSAKVALRIAAGVFLFMLLNMAQFVRNQQLTGSPLGLPFAEAGNRLRFRDDDIGPSVAFSGIIRNVALHLGTPIRRVNYSTEWVLRRVIHISGADPDDPRTTWRDAFKVPAMTGREYFQGNPGQFLLICAVGVWAIFRWRDAPRNALILLLGLAVAFCAFSAVMKWNLSGARYHLPLFVLGASVLGVYVTRIVGPRISLGLGFAGLLAAVPFLAGNSLRSLVPGNRNYVFGNARQSLYFADDAHGWQEPFYRASAEEIARSGCREVGIDATLQTYVYPIMALVKEREPAAKFKYIGVKNMTRSFGERLHRAAPCAVMCLGCMKVKTKWTEYMGPGARAAVFGDTDVFLMGSQLASEAETARGTNRSSAKELALGIAVDYSALKGVPLDSLLGELTAETPQWTKDWEWQTRCDSLREMALRWVAIWEWSEPMRRRAFDGSASDADLNMLTTISEGLPQLHALLEEQIRNLKWSVSRGNARDSGPTSQSTFFRDEYKRD